MKNKIRQQKLEKQIQHFLLFFKITMGKKTSKLKTFDYVFFEICFKIKRKFTNEERIIQGGKRISYSVF